MQAGLPSFKKLVEDIYDSLPETWAMHPAEEEAMDARAYDRALRCLERRCGGTDPKTVLNIREKIRDGVRNSFRGNARSYPAHLSILRLSRDGEMRHRVVTTNFDPLFERAWNRKHKGAARISSHAGASLPGPQSAGFTGVLHLHGRIRDKAQKLDETDLILTSAEFGDAYLRSGWAARYIYDLVRALTVVIVGYSADDPPMRYLLEVIDADRERFRDLREVFAFVPAKPGEEARQIELWKAKGATPIPYRTPTDSDHSSLYQSLEQWATYAEDPTKWRRAALHTLLTSEPEKVSTDGLREIQWLLSGGDAAEILLGINPSPSWLPKLAELNLLKPDGQPHMPWIAANFGSMEMLEACLGLGRVVNGDLQTAFIRMELTKQYATLNPFVRTAWRLLARTTKGEGPWPSSALGRMIDARTQMKAGDVNYDVVKSIGAFLRPRLSVRTPFRMVEMAIGAPPAKLGDLIRVEFESPLQQVGARELDTIIGEIPNNPDLELQIISQLGRELIDALDEAADAKFTRPEYDQASHQVPSVAPHEQNEYARGFYFLVRALADLWTRLAKSDPRRAGRITAWSLEQPYILPQRIGLEFLTNDAVHSGSEACGALAALPDEMFWRHAKREVMRLTATRWNDFSTGEQYNLEARIVAGPPASLYPGATMSSKFAALRDWAVLTRLNRIVQAGGKLSEQGQEALTRLMAQFPDYEMREDDRDDFDVWFGGAHFVGPQGNVDLVKDVPIDQLVPTTLRIESEHQWEQGDLWSNLCREEPDRAIAAIANAPGADRWTMNAWQPLLDTLSMTKDPAIAPKILDLLLASPADLIERSADYVARWLERQRTILAGTPQLLQSALTLWDRVAATVYIDAADGEQKAKASRDAVSDPGGVLAEFLVQVVSAQQRAQDAGWPPELEQRATQAVQCTGSNGLMARTVFAMRLALLDYLDHDWVSRYLVSWFDWANEEAKPLWRARAYDNHPGLPRLFNQLKIPLLQAIRRPDIDHSDATNLLALMLRAYLHKDLEGGQTYEIDRIEIRRTLADASSDTRHAATWVLAHWIAPPKADQEAALTPDQMWRDRYGQFFRDVWPLEANLRDERTSQNLIRMAMACDECLADAVNAIIGFVVPFDMFDIGITLGLDDRPGFLETHPRPILDLLNAAIDSRVHMVPRDLMAKLEKIATVDTSLTDLASYNRLVGEWRRRQARA